MRSVGAVLAILLLGASAAYADEAGLAAGLASRGPREGCIYAGLFYSHGAQICVVRGGPALECQDDNKWKAGAGIDCSKEPFGGAASHQ
jgi:hypothetical protein